MNKIVKRGIFKGLSVKARNALVCSCFSLNEIKELSEQGRLQSIIGVGDKLEGEIDRWMKKKENERSSRTSQYTSIARI